MSHHRFHVFAHEDSTNLPTVTDEPIEIACDASLDEGAIIRTVAPYDSIGASRTQYFCGLEGHEVNILLHALSLLMPAGEQYSEDITWLSERLGRITAHIARAEAAEQAGSAEDWYEGDPPTVLEDITWRGSDLEYGMRTLMTVAAIRRAKTEILQDIASGAVPHTVASFSELHDYRDANVYGGLCDTYGFTMDDEDPFEFANQVQGAVDDWLKAGRPVPSARVHVSFELGEGRP